MFMKFDREEIQSGFNFEVYAAGLAEEIIGKLCSDGRQLLLLLLFC